MAVLLWYPFCTHVTYVVPSGSFNLRVYRIDEEGLVLVATRTGSHSELLGL